MKYYEVFKEGMPFEIYQMKEEERLKLNFELHDDVVKIMPPENIYPANIKTHHAILMKPFNERRKLYNIIDMLILIITFIVIFYMVLEV